MTSDKKPRGRPRAYERARAVQQARDAFWLSGYEGTSLDALAAAMQMNRPSIYAAFGDKAGLYAEVTRRYADQSVRALAQTLAREGTLRENLADALHGAAKFYLEGSHGPRGCFLVGTALTEARGDPALRKLLDHTFERFTELFAERFARAEAGELPALPARALAELATAILLSLSVRARSGASRHRLARLVDAGLSALCGP